MTDDGIARAQARADRARTRLTEALAALKDRLAPRTIARNLARDVKDKGIDAAIVGVDTVRARPAVAAGVAALAALFLARKPIARAISGDGDETADPSARLDDDPSAKEKR